VEDGAALQTGIGGAPAALLAHLKDRSGLVIRSGMVTEGYRDLFEAGALAPREAHVAGIAYGGPDFLGWVADNDLCAFASAARTHRAADLARTPRFTAVNSALEVDLFGQVNVEWLNGRPVSGVGGAPDFSQAAAGSERGVSLVALASCAGAHGPSRIIPRILAPTVSLPRHETDAVVTEHGIARIRGLWGDARAEALIAVADPAHRDRLKDDWRTLRRWPGDGPASAPR
jgi:acyl-CoA hydrolase